MWAKFTWAVLLLCGTLLAAEGPGVSSYWYKGNQVDVQTLDGVTIQAALMSVGHLNRVDIRTGQLKEGMSFPTLPRVSAAR